jgi:hypothetical protein
MNDQIPELIIDGHPRTGTTFLRTAATTAWSKDDVLVTGRRHIAQTLYSTDHLYVVTARDPVDTCVSFVTQQQGKLSTADALKRYVEYYEAVFENRDHLIIALFVDIAADINYVMRQIELRSKKTYLANRTEITNEEITSKLDFDTYGQGEKAFAEWLHTGHIPRARPAVYEGSRSRLLDDKNNELLTRAWTLYDAMLRLDQEQKVAIS